MEEGKNNIIWWAIAAFVAGYALSRYRNNAQFKNKVDLSVDKAERNILKLVDSILRGAAAEGKSVEEVRKEIANEEPDEQTQFAHDTVVS